MPVNCGIVGMPNVGKTTIFSALTSTKAETSNYAFSTIDPNYGSVDVPDKRLFKISELIKPLKTLPTTVEFVDLAGLVRGSSKGEGLGNQFLANIRQVGAIIHVVRCFDDENIHHVEGSINPIRDIETIEIELAFADLESINRKIENLAKQLRSNDRMIAERAKILEPVLQKVSNELLDGIPLRKMELTDEQLFAMKDMNLITLKQQIYCCNVDEKFLGADNDYVKSVKEYAVKNGSDVIVISGKLEAEISEFETEDERREFLDSAGLDESGLDQLIRAAYHSLDLQTYFTAGEKEVRAWTFKRGMKAPQAAGIIHSDFERGFIKAEVYHCTDLFELKTEAKLREYGKMRLEGKEYIVKDGDVIHFRFNV